MSKSAGRDTPQRIIDVVLELLHTEGYESVQLREVARRARVSLATVYKLFATRDQLIVVAIEQWMAANAYPDLAPPVPDESLNEGLMRVMRHVFEPWERSPRMLEAFYLARSAPGGIRLDNQGFDAVLPVAAQIFGNADPDYVEDVGLVLTSMIYALIGRVVDKTLKIDQMLPILERVMRRLTINNEPDARAALDRPVTAATEPYVWDPVVLATFNGNPEPLSNSLAGQGNTVQSDAGAEIGGPDADEERVAETDR